MVPLIICITRLVAQKGIHLIAHAIKRVEELGGQLILLGKASDGRVQRDFEGLANLVLAANVIALAWNVILSFKARK
ncbi:hypothetical protein Scep_025456 [Stephania cephalantha]|uniref:starch synthase n=1 Tax=Stephania cephalantha TaxID=152367 RepID=A0AAP0HR80_9MAGN